ncbi:MAG: tRNA1(Val) (adenine(37)-N6)-methyltransferase [Syntrophales bacterium]|jgi:tRNA1Val (adenine37-N6)-methyltransferase
MKKNVSRVSKLRREGETVDELLGRRVKIFQKKKGYRFSVDALLLAHFVRVRKGDLIADLGTGSGVIAIIVAQRKECYKVAGVDIQEELVDMATRSVMLNDLQEKVNISHGDVRKIETLFKPGSFDVSILNPPYRRVSSGKLNPNAEKSVARHEIKASLHDFLKASTYLLKKSGRVYIIYPATRMVGLLSSMRTAGMEPKRLRIVHSHTASRGEFVLVEGVKNGREELEVLPPLTVYSEDGQYTEAMDSLFRELCCLPKASAE